MYTFNIIQDDEYLSVDWNPIFLSGDGHNFRLIPFFIWIDIRLKNESVFTVSSWQFHFKHHWCYSIGPPDIED